MQGAKFVRKKLSRLDRRSNPELIRLELFACITYVFLSKEYFKKNKDILDFNESTQIFLKKYVYASRTLIVARVNREIEKATDDKLYLMLEKIKEIVFSEIELGSKRHQKNSGEDNYLDSIMNQFSRGKINSD